MSERGTGSIVDWLEIDVGRLSGQERVALITEIMENLTAQELRTIRDVADKKREGKLKDARAAVISEMKQRLGEVDLTLEEVMEFEEENKQKRTQRKRESDGAVRIKYRSPEGEGWSGRGRAPVWLRNLEAEGHNREEYLVQAEE